MTAEVAIINSSAVAIAADSAVTIGQQKIYNSALKVFFLSKVAPVAIMVYGNAGIHEVPWEPVIKSFREELSGNEVPSLSDYSKRFFKYLAGHSQFFPPDARSSWIQSNVGSYYVLIRSELEQAIRRIVKRKGSITTAETESAFKRAVDKHHAELRAKDRLSNFSVSFETKIRKKFVDIFRKAKDDVFEKLGISRPYITKLYDIGCYVFTRDIFPDSTSGIVIAGFGKNDVYPSVITHKVHGIIDGRLKCRREPHKCMSIEHPNDCGIIPFAQEDMVDTFMKGWNPSIQNFLLQYVSQLLVRFPDLLDDSELQGNKKAKKAIRDRLKNDTQQLYNQFQSQLVEHIQKEQIYPILNMVSVLPKDELAAMAESLVNLTAFKRKITHDMETVGGPIDVAVISKGDGLVWVKRKHYFPQELNQHFFANYFRSV